MFYTLENLSECVTKSNFSSDFVHGNHVGAVVRTGVGDVPAD